MHIKENIYIFFQTVSLCLAMYWYCSDCRIDDTVSPLLPFLQGWQCDHGKGSDVDSHVNVDFSSGED